MKPHPDSICRALALLAAESSSCCMIGDSVTDINVCAETGVHSIGFAKNPKRGEELVRAGADALVDSMSDLAYAVISSSG